MSGSGTKPPARRESIEGLRARLEEAEQTLSAIRSGEVDAIIIGGPAGDRVFTLKGADHSYRVLMDRMSEGVVTLSESGVITYCNSRFAELMARPPEQLVGGTLHDAIPGAPSRLSAVLKAGEHAVSSADFVIPSPDGSRRPVRLSVSTVELETGPTLCAIATDLTEQRRQEQALADERAEREAALRDSESRYRRIVETAVEGIWLLDPEGRTTFANRALGEMLGHSPAELRGRLVYDFLDAASAEDARRTLERRRRNTEMRELGFVRKDRQELWALFSTSPIHDDAGVFQGSVVMLSDVSDRRKMQAQLLLADRMSSLGTLSAGVAHEINNPLAYTIASLDLMAARMPEPAACPPDSPAAFLAQQLQRAREGAERVRTIVRDLKSFSRADEEKVGDVDLRKCLDTSLTLVWNEIKHRARLEKDYSGLPPVRANEARLGQVFINLLVNAAQAMPEGNIERNLLRVIGKSDALGNAVVEIQDSGCGIPAENLDRIFEPFFTTKPVGEGTGLGLAICHGIISSLGGTLSAQSEVGRGTVFRVVLPLARVQPQAPQPALRAVPKPGRRGRILLIDDEKDLTDVTRDGLIGLHDVLTTQDARQGLEWIAAGDRFDLILCDMMMPLMTGMEFHTRLEALAPAQAERVVFMTGGAFTPRAREFFSRLPNLRLEKPFDLDVILEVVAQHLIDGAREASLEQASGAAAMPA